jgi:hypothetical protein
MLMSTNVSGLANRFPGWRLQQRSSKSLTVRANARGAAEHGEDGDWCSERENDWGVEEEECGGDRDLISLKHSLTSLLSPERPEAYRLSFA